MEKLKLEAQRKIYKAGTGTRSGHNLAVEGKVPPTKILPAGKNVRHNILKTWQFGEKLDSWRLKINYSLKDFDFGRAPRRS